MSLFQRPSALWKARAILPSEEGRVEPSSFPPLEINTGLGCLLPQGGPENHLSHSCGIEEGSRSMGYHGLPSDVATAHSPPGQAQDRCLSREEKSYYAKNSHRTGHPRLQATRQPIKTPCLPQKPPAQTDKTGYTTISTVGCAIRTRYVQVLTT